MSWRVNKENETNMKEEEKLIDRYGRKGPWTVPDGYVRRHMVHDEGLSQRIGHGSAES